jgi:nucleoid DNA-binding protein
MSKGLNADDIGHDIHRDLHHLSLTKGACEEIVKGVFAAIKQRVAAGEIVNIRGFGVFQAKVFKGRTLNSPLVEGGSIQFGDQLVLRFRQSPAAKREINEIAAQAGKKAKKSADKPAKGKKAAEAEASEPEAPEAEAAEGSEAEAPEAKPAKKGNGKAAPAKAAPAKAAPAKAKPEAAPAKPAKGKGKAAEA